MRSPAAPGDPYLLALNSMLARFGRPAYLRVMAEMNNWNNPYSAFGAQRPLAVACALDA